MAPRRTAVPVLVAGMLVAGSANSLLAKYQDMQCVENCGSDGRGRPSYYEQPVFQSLNMFLGEMLCMVPVIMQYLRHRHRLHKTASTYTLVTQVDEEEEHRFVNSDRNSENESLSPKMTASGHIPPPTISGFAMCWLFFPALFDILGTTLMNVGLILVPVSIYQMSRGALVLWVGVLSVMFLSRRLRAYQWAALIIVVIGVGIVGLSGSLVKKAVTDDGDQLYVVAVHGVKEVLKRAFSPGIVATQATKVEDDDPAKVLVGVLFILFAQVFTASQFVIEEKIMTWYSVEPLLAVGLEGLFGFWTIVLAMPFLHRFLSSTSPYFDIPRGYHQTVDNKIVLLLSGVICISIACFNVFGLSVTRAVSAAARSTIDTCRTIGIWAVSLGLGWEKLVWPFSLLQITGFILLVYGTFVFNGLLRPIIYAPSREEANHLPHEDELEQTAIVPAAAAEGRTGYDVIPVEEDERPHRD